MLATNKDRLVMQSVTGVVHNPVIRTVDTRTDNSGLPFALPTVGGICYNVNVGDSVYAFEGDHIEPCVSLKNFDVNEDKALNFLAAIGNAAKVMTGDAKGEKGYVAGKHGGIEHVIVQFESSAVEKMCPGDVVLIKSFGQGLCAEGFEEVHFKNIDPLLLESIVTEKEKKLCFETAAFVPAFMMGSGIGYASSYSGDYDIMTADNNAVIKYGLDKLKLGDVVCLTDSDTRYGRGYREGFMTVGVIVHSNCKASGHGPGVVTIMSGERKYFEPTLSKNANIVRFLPIKR